MPWNQEGKPIKMQPVQVNVLINHYQSSNIKKQDGLIFLLQILSGMRIQVSIQFTFIYIAQIHSKCFIL